ncbi:hypothetical protein KPL78_06765 [Roseomonas sp. HJA6]|uniref:Uncharacterized protein n=1 Tax=Roseomonas alba TaxID=2846776 RepID=A0ABS7A5I5_9PROT|nr:hypothetical protein [Neoroseomonas alba]MBW6397540.1 hypothetical protein [Neoroseomonas alba]
MSAHPRAVMLGTVAHDDAAVGYPGPLTGGRPRQVPRQRRPAGLSPGLPRAVRDTKQSARPNSDLLTERNVRLIRAWNVVRARVALREGESVAAPLPELAKCVAGGCITDPRLEF